MFVRVQKMSIGREQKEDQAKSIFRSLIEMIFNLVIVVHYNA
jgi:hypothetical protein